MRLLRYPIRNYADETAKRLANRWVSFYGLADAKLVIAQGFSISDVSKDLSQSELYQAQINRLKNKLSLAIQRSDSISSQQKLGDPILKEIRPLFPEVTYCSAERQQFFKAGAAARNYTVVVVGTSNARQTMRDLNRINNWLKVRLKTDSVKVFVEKSTF